MNSKVSFNDSQLWWSWSSPSVWISSPCTFDSSQEVSQGMCEWEIYIHVMSDLANDRLCHTTPRIHRMRTFFLFSLFHFVVVRVRENLILWRNVELLRLIETTSLDEIITFFFGRWNLLCQSEERLRPGNSYAKAFCDSENRLKNWLNSALVDISINSFMRGEERSKSQHEPACTLPVRGIDHLLSN